MRDLDQHKIPYKATEVEGDFDNTHGVEVASALGKDAAEVYKTLVTESVNSKAYYVFVIPVGEKLSLKKAASVTGEKKIQMLAQKELLPLTGYVHGGCSPLGMKTVFPTFIDDSASNFEKITFNGGRVGLQIEVGLEDLSKVLDYKLADVTED